MIILKKYDKMKGKNMLIIICVEVFIIILGLSYLSACLRDKTHKEIYEKGYIDACKDFHKGKLKYDLIENEDGIKVWKKVD